MSDTTKTAPALLIDAKAASLALSIGSRRLWELTDCGAIPCRRIGRLVRYSPDELAAWVDAGCPTEPGAGAAIREAVRP